jgi:hypothetical protein
VCETTAEVVTQTLGVGSAFEYALARHNRDGVRFGEVTPQQYAGNGE